MTVTINFSESLFQPAPGPTKTKVGHPASHALVPKCALILGALLSGQKVTAKDAVDNWDIYSLAEVVFYLRHHDGVPVKTTMLKSTHPDGYVTPYAEYSLTAADIAEIKAKKVLQ